MESTKDLRKTRFDTRLTYAQKELFEKARLIGGYRSMSDFVVSTVEEKAKEIIKNEELIIASQQDAEIFADALLNPDAPNTALIKAFNKHMQTIHD